MIVKWLGHSSFMITSDKGVKIITDPYKTGRGLKYGEIKESADSVTVSHEHGDHNNTVVIGGNPQIIRGLTPVDVKGIKINGVATFHDAEQGNSHGTNTAFCFEVDGIRICHLGDLGHKLNEQQVGQIGRVDVLLTPMAGFFTMDAEVATEVANQLTPKIIIPMHFRNERCDYPISAVDDFLKGKKNVTMMNSSEIELNSGKIPDETRIIVLKPAL